MVNKVNFVIFKRRQKENQKKMAGLFNYGVDLFKKDRLMSCDPSTP